MHSFPKRGKERALREGLAITFWLLGMNCAASCRRAEGKRREAVDFLSLRGGLKRVREKRAGAGRGLEKPLLTLQRLPKEWVPGLVNFFHAVAYHLCLSLSAKFSQPGANLFGQTCISGRNWKTGLKREDHRKQSSFAIALFCVIVYKLS